MLIDKTVRNYRNLQRLRQITSLLIKHGFGFLVNRLNLTEHLPLGRRLFERQFPDETLAVRLRLALEGLGTTFIKFGQLLSTRPDLIPQEFIEELKKLQDKVPPFSYPEVQELFRSEFKKNIGDIYRDFSVQPIASASIAQVHSAALRSGEKAAVKVRRPGIERAIKTDLDILGYIASLAEKHMPELKLYEPVNLVREFECIINGELDFTREGHNTDRFARNFAQDKTVHIPKVYWEFSRRTILTLERVEGIKINTLAELESAGLDRSIIAQNGANAVLKQVFIDGFFHGDPHPGNIRVLENNVIAFLDFGVVGILDEETKRGLTGLLLAMIRKDTAGIIDIFLNMGFITEEAAEPRLKHDLEDLMGKYYGLPLRQLETGKLIQELFHVVNRHKIRIPPDFVLMGKALITIEGIGRELDPGFNLSVQLRPFAQQLIRDNMGPSRLWNELTGILRDYAGLLKVLPRETRQILGKLREGKLKIEFEAQGLEHLTHTLDKVSNRIAFSMIIAALIIGSSLIMQTNKGILFWGYPVPGILGFLTAALMGIFLLISILRSRKY